MHRQHDSAAATPPDHCGHEFGAGLDVHVLRSGGLCLGEQPLALLFRAAEAPPFPGRAARHDDGTAPALDRPRRVGVIDSVEPELHQVRVRDAVARMTELFHRSAGHGDAD